MKNNEIYGKWRYSYVMEGFMNYNDKVLENFALCAFFHKRRLCNNNCNVCPLDVMKNVPFKTQGELFELVIKAISVSMSIIYKKQKEQYEKRTQKQGKVKKIFFGNARNISEKMNCYKTGPNGFETIFVANYMAEDTFFYISQNNFVISKEIKGLSGTKIHLDPKKQFEYLIADGNMNYEYQWRYCGMLEIDILGILENGGCD